jgi:hypothetical protein
MLSNTLTLKGKIRRVLSDCKTTLFSLINIKKKICLNKSWSRVKSPKNLFAIVIATGPSFNKEIVKNILLKRKYFDLIAINYYFLNGFSEKLIPDYYLLSDPEQVETNNNVVKKINKSLKKYISHPKIKFIAPYDDRWRVYKNPYLQFDDSQNLSSDNINPRKPRGYRSNTGMKAIAMMLALGYEKIFMVGFDYEYPRKIILDKNNKLLLQENHSYGSQIIDQKKDFSCVAHALHWWALDLWHLKKFKSKRIINVTKNSMIDVFTRMSPQDFKKFIKEI